MKTKVYLPISELSRLTGIPSSTIKFYQKEGLISFPLKKGKTRAYYNDKHIIQLETLKRLRTDDNLSIEEIKIRLTNSKSINEDIEADISTDTDRKNDIITAAIELFRTAGYNNISMNNIAERAGISKGTFYKHFSSKEDLFYECADKVFYDIDREFKELLNEKDIMSRFKLRLSLFIKTHRHMIDMLQLVRGTSTGVESKKKRLKFNQIIENMAEPIASDLEEGIKLGLFKNMNTHITAHILMGAVEYGIYFCDDKTDLEIEQNIEMGVSIILQGIMQNSENQQWTQR
jgi:AcrR family transcriptional regulator